MWETFYVLRRLKYQGLFFYNIVAARWVRAPGNNFQFAISMDVDQQCKASKSRTQQRKILLENFLCNMICDMRVCVQSSYEIVYEDNLKGLCTQPFPFKYFRVYIREDHPTKTGREKIKPVLMLSLESQQASLDYNPCDLFLSWYFEITKGGGGGGIGFVECIFVLK